MQKGFGRLTSVVPSFLGRFWLWHSEKILCKPTQIKPWGAIWTLQSSYPQLFAQSPALCIHMQMHLMARIEILVEMVLASAGGVLWTPY